MTAMQIDCLREKGHSHIGLLHGYRDECPSLIQLERQAVHYRKMAEHRVLVYPVTGPPVAGI